MKSELLHPALRRRGMLLKRLPPMGPRMFRLGNWFLDTFAAGRCHTKSLHYEQRYILRPDGTRLRLCIYHSRSQGKNLPGLLWMHGGGYATGIPEQDEGFVACIQQAADCVVVAPDYTRSTEKPFPAALEDCYLALLWFRDHCKGLGADPQKLMIGGDSAGGGLTAALSLYARDRGQVKLAFQMPLYPMLDARPTDSSRNNHAPIWNTRSNNAAWRLYLGADYGTDRVSKYACPALETDYSGLPPAFTYVGSIEPFYDETLTYVENLRRAGVPVQCQVFEGCFHGFDITCSKSAPAKAARALLAEQFRQAAEPFTAVQSSSKRCALQNSV